MTSESDADTSGTKRDRETRPEHAPTAPRDVIPLTSPSPPSSDSNIEKTRTDIAATNKEKSEKIRGRKPRSGHPKHTLIFADVRAKYPEVAESILSLCKSVSNSLGRPLILRGRYGYYGSNMFRRAVFKESEDIFDHIKENTTEIQWAVIDNLHEEGMVFASYDSLLACLADRQIDSHSNGG